MNRDWLAVFESLKGVYTDGAYSNMAISEALFHHKGCKESFVRNYAKGVLRDTIRLDYFIDRLAAKGIDKIKSRPLIVLRMGIYAIDSLGSVPDHAAVNESVNLARKVARGSEGFVNGMLRSYLRERDNLVIPSDRDDVKYSVNPAIISLLRGQYGEEAEDILRALNEPQMTIIRVNRLRADRGDVIDGLNAMGIEAKASNESPNAIEASGSGIVSSDMYKAGMISMQSLSSMLAIEAAGLSSKIRVLDMCAAPGGKSAYMAELMDDDGEITACDIHDHRLELIKKTQERLGLSIIKTLKADGSVRNPEMVGRFDFVLADVPCSGLGVMSSKPEIAFKSNPESYAELTDIQKSILRNAVAYTKPGGRIEYSTCTLNKDENEKVIESIMAESKGSLLSVIEMKTLMPYNSKVGFFYCILKKNSGD